MESSSVIKRVLALAIISMGSAHASSSLSVSTSDLLADKSNANQNFQIQDPVGATTLSASSGLSSAMGLVDASTGTIKLSTQAVTGNNTVWTGAWANASINDTIYVAHSDPYAKLAVSLSFNFLSTATYSYSASDAIRNSELAKTTYDTAGVGRVNANFSLYGMDINMPSDNYEMPFGTFSFNKGLFLESNAGPYVELNHPSSTISEIWNDGIYSRSYSAPNGQLSSLTISTILDVPTNTDVSLNYSVEMSALCSVMGQCSILFDGSHSFHLGVTALEGTLSSANGYSYIGAPVPEPESYAMMLAGLGFLGAITRRRKRN
jgi:hypothetical protein